MNLLEQLKKVTTVVADSGDVDSIKTLKPVDATTNPSLILQAAELPQYQYLLDKSIAQAVNASERPTMDDICDQLIVNFGCEILKHIPGRISSEVDARLSFDTAATVEKGKKLIALYQQAGIEKERVLIKIAATWQGIKAAEQLEKQGIACNLTLLFSMAQAIACAEAKVTLISPFVGRILDWHKAKTNLSYITEADPGVQSVTAIYKYFKQYDYNTQIMGASFRSIEQVIALAGCDLLTVSPKLLQQLASSEGELITKLSPDLESHRSQSEITPLTEQAFLWQHNQNAMAVEKLSEGIRQFAKDQDSLTTLISHLIR